MRVLSARIAQARRDRATGRVEAIVSLTVLRAGEPVLARIRTSAPARATGAAKLRARLLGAAKLQFATDTAQWRARRAA